MPAGEDRDVVPVDSWGGTDDAFRWNCTEVYRRDAGGWRIIQTHWSFTNAGRR
jgi:hypothetical protein